MAEVPGDKVEQSFTTDSGYVTAQQSPDEGLGDEDVNACSVTPNPVRLKPSSSAPVQKRQSSVREVDESTIFRFNEIRAQIEEPLLKHIRKGRGKYLPVAIRLKVLEETSKPCIVVFCPENKCDRVRQYFFKKKSVKALWQPEDKSLPSFEVAVVGRPPEPKAEECDINVSIPVVNGKLGFSIDTFCGSPILLTHPLGRERRATFGGMIKLTDINGEFALYGMTAGHVIDYLGDELSDKEEVDSEIESISPGEFSDLDIFDYEEASATAKRVERLLITASNRLDLNEDGAQMWRSDNTEAVGNIMIKGGCSSLAKQGKNKAKSKYYDWALIKMRIHKPNRLYPRQVQNKVESGDPEFRSGDLVMPFKSRTYPPKERPVVMLSGSDGPKRGRLSALSSGILLSPGEAFVTTLLLSLDDGKSILDGDSGSWIADEATLEVYGHLIAVDAFGDGYVIPLPETFDDIKQQLGVTSVELPSTIDTAVAGWGVSDASDRVRAIPDTDLFGDLMGRPSRAIDKGNLHSFTEPQMAEQGEPDDDSSYSEHGKLHDVASELNKTKQFYERTLKGEAPGQEQASTISTVHNLGTFYRNQGRFYEAEQVYQWGLKGFEAALGREHTLTLQTVHNLGVLYRIQGRLTEAEQMYQWAFKGFQAALGREHKLTLETVHNLGTLYRVQGRLTEAEQMYQWALKGFEAALGREHTSTLETINNIGVLYRVQGKLAKAEQMYKQALKGKEAALGREHTSTLSTVHNLGVLYRNQGRLDEAEQMYRWALKGFEAALGQEHFSTLKTAHKLGTLYEIQGRLIEAEQMFQRARK